jgi:hypothetical protein
MESTPEVSFALLFKYIAENRQHKIVHFQPTFLFSLHIYHAVFHIGCLTSSWLQKSDIHSKGSDIEVSKEIS